MMQVTSKPASGFRIAASIEATPTQVVGADRIEGLFPAGTSVYLTDVGMSPTQEIVDAAKRLTEAGYSPVPHLAARRYASVGDLAVRLARLTAEAGVSDVLVIGGNGPTAAGPFQATLDVLRTGLLDNHGIRRIGIAGHPEGSPDISAAEVAAARAAKQAFADETGAQMRIVTQFGFDADRFIGWAEGLKESGNRLPIHIGVAGPAKITTLLKYAAICGVGASMDFLKKRASSLVALATSYSPEAVVSPVEQYVADHPEGPIAQIHVFPFGGLRKSAEWLAERGSWFGSNGNGAELDVVG